ncbi:hypothetical protein ACQCS2_08375, partial [Ralstonia pseudosolanacearum]
MTRSTALPLGHAPDHAERRGLLLGFIGVAIFSQTLPFTRMAVAELDRIVARHEALRTCFVTEEGQAVQRVASADVGFA